MRRRTLTMDLMDEPALDGTGDALELRLTGDKITRRGAGELERYTVTIKMPRFVLRRLLEQIRAMHERDRERLEREQLRRRTEAHLLSVDFKP